MCVIARIRPNGALRLIIVPGLFVVFIARKDFKKTRTRKLPMHTYDRSSHSIPRYLWASIIMILFTLTHHKH